MSNHGKDQNEFELLSRYLKFEIEKLSIDSFLFASFMFYACDGRVSLHSYCIVRCRCYSTSFLHPRWSTTLTLRRCSLHGSSYWCYMYRYRCHYTTVYRTVVRVRSYTVRIFSTQNFIPRTSHVNSCKKIVRGTGYGVPKWPRVTRSAKNVVMNISIHDSILTKKLFTF